MASGSRKDSSTPAAGTAGAAAAADGEEDESKNEEDLHWLQMVTNEDQRHKQEEQFHQLESLQEGIANDLAVATATADEDKLKKEKEAAWRRNGGRAIASRRAKHPYPPVEKGEGPWKEDDTRANDTSAHTAAASNSRGEVGDSFTGELQKILHDRAISEGTPSAADATRPTTACRALSAPVTTPGAYAAAPGQGATRNPVLNKMAFYHPSASPQSPSENKDGENPIPLFKSNETAQHMELGETCFQQGGAAHHASLDDTRMTESNNTADPRHDNHHQRMSQSFQLSPSAEFDLGLMEAIPVQENDDNLSVATPLAPSETAEYLQQERRTKTLKNTVGFVVIGLIIVVGIILLVFFLVLQKDDDNMMNGTNIFPATTTPTMAPTAFLLDLPEYTTSAILDDPMSPQARAYQWLRQDPNLSNYTLDRMKTRLALATFYYSTTITDGGGNWLQNNSLLAYDKHECESFINDHFVLLFGKLDLDLKNEPPCDDAQHFKRLWLGSNALVGQIPEEFYWLTSLESFDLSNNPGISGTLSTRIGLLSNLKHMSVSSTGMSGTVPTELGLCTNLEDFVTMFVPFTGNLPSEFGLLTKMERFRLAFSQLTGAVPSELGQWKSVKTLDTTFNKFSGTIPTQLGLLSSVQYFNLGSNQFSGTIPTDLGRLESAFLLDLYSNQLTGTIPTDVGRLHKQLQSFTVHRNSLTGNLPSEIGLWDVAYWVTISNNQLSGLPTEIGPVTSLLSLQAEGNQFAAVPSELGLCTKLDTLLADNNNLTSFPSELGQLTALTILSLANNALTSVPTEMALLENLEGLYLGSNLLTSVPFYFGNLSSLTDLDLSDNPLQYRLPTDMWSLTHLERLWLNGLYSVDGDEARNQSSFDFTIPTLIGQLRFLQLFVSRGAGWTGPLPSELGLLHSLVCLHLDENYLSGTIPSDLNNLVLVRNGSSLMEFNVSQNNLDDQVPEELCTLNASLGFDCPSTLCGCQCLCN